MKRMIRFRFVFSLCIFILVLAACSSSSSVTQDTKVTKREKQVFAEKVSSICSSIEVSDFPNLFDVLNDSVEEANAFVTQAQGAEDSIDDAVSRFSDVEPPAAFEEDWDALVDDFSAVRDSYPKLAEAAQRYADVASDLSIEAGEEAYKQADKELTEIEDDVDIISRDLDQRYKAIRVTSNKYDFEECDLER